MAGILAAVGLPTILTGGAVACALAAAGGAYGMHKFDDGRYQALVAADAKAQTAAVTAASAEQKRQDDINTKAALDESTAQTALLAAAIQRSKEIPIYVTPAQDKLAANGPGCVTYGLVRLHDAAVLQVDPSTLQLPAGKSNDACSPIAPSALADTLSSNYGASNENAEQVNALEADEASRAPKPQAKSAGKGFHVGPIHLP